MPNKTFFFLIKVLSKETVAVHKESIRLIYILSLTLRLSIDALEYSFQKPSERFNPESTRRKEV